MDIDTFTSLIPIISVIISPLFYLPKLVRAWDDLRYLRRDRRKREADFANMVFERSGNIHIKYYAEQLGYAALIGDRNLNTEERLFLLSLKNSEKAIQKYLGAARWIHILLNCNQN